jgi:hypothetical protein
MVQSTLLIQPGGSIISEQIPLCFFTDELILPVGHE